MNIKSALLAMAAILGLLPTAMFAQDVQKNVTYVCNGERVVIDSCNIRDTSDTSTCMVGHPDTVLPNGLMKYTTETRGALKKLLPTCKQPSADETARATAFEKKQNDLYEANVAKANKENDAIEARAQQVVTGRKPQTPEERAITRCITSGRLAASCTGNALLGAFGQMLSSVLPSSGTQAASAGPTMAGVFQGAGGWRLDFIDDGVLVNCSGLSPNQQSYRLEFKNERTALIIDTTPKPLVLTLRADGTIVGPGPVTIDGVVATGYSGGGGGGDSTYSGNYRDGNGRLLTNSEAAGASNVYDQAGNRVFPAGNNAGGGHATFSPRRATCPALNLSSKGAGAGVETMETDLLKTAFGGDKGAPTPPGIRMHGIFAASTGFSVQFFPESAVLGCGPDAARAYPYTVVANGTKAVIQIAAPDHPLTLAFQPDGSLDPGGSGAYQVHGRTVIGQNDDGDFTFAPLEQACNLAVLAASKEIPSGGGVATMTASAGNGGVAGAASGGGNISSPNAPMGNAVLNIASGLPAPAGAPNPLAGHSYVLLRDEFDAALRKGGVDVPAGTTGIKVLGAACSAGRTPECAKVIAAITADTASAIRADAAGKASLPGVTRGSYFLMINTQYNGHVLSWGFRVDLKPGANSVTLDQNNATLLR